MEHRYHTSIKVTHLDLFGHVNNAKYFELYEEARWELLKDKGYGIEIIQTSRKGPVILRADIRFKREIKGNTAITILTRPVSYIGKIFTLDQEIVDDRKVSCSTATFVGGYFDMEQRKLIKPDSHWLTVFEGVEWHRRNPTTN